MFKLDSLLRLVKERETKLLKIIQTPEPTEKDTEETIKVKNDGIIYTGDLGYVDEENIYNHDSIASQQCCVWSRVSSR